MGNTTTKQKWVISHSFRYITNKEREAGLVCPGTRCLGCRACVQETSRGVRRHWRAFPTRPASHRRAACFSRRPQPCRPQGPGAVLLRKGTVGPFLRAEAMLLIMRVMFQNDIPMDSPRQALPSWLFSFQFLAAISLDSFQISLSCFESSLIFMSKANVMSP